MRDMFYTCLPRPHKELSKTLRTQSTICGEISLQHVTCFNIRPKQPLLLVTYLQVKAFEWVWLFLSQTRPGREGCRLSDTVGNSFYHKNVNSAVGVFALGEFRKSAQKHASTLVDTDHR